MIFDVFRSFLIDIEGFDDKHQHVLMPTSLITGVIGHVAEKALDHLESRKKEAMVGAAAPIAAASEADSESPNATTSKRPTIIDFMAKFKTKRSVDSGKADWGCSSKLSLAEVIGEHKVDTNVDKKVVESAAPEHEIEEVANGEQNERAKRSTDDNVDRRQPSPASPCGTSSCPTFPPKQPEFACSTGTCDRIET